MKRLGYIIAIALLTPSSPAMSMPNAFWIFGFDIPLSHPNRNTSAAGSERTPLRLTDMRPCSVTGFSAAPDTIIQNGAVDSALKPARDRRVPMLEC